MLTIKFLEEVAEVANSEGVNFGFDIIETTLKHINRLPFGTTSSMHTDFLKGRTTELESLTGIVPSLAKLHGIETPYYQMVYENLKMHKRY